MLDAHFFYTFRTCKCKFAAIVVDQTNEQMKKQTNTQTKTTSVCIKGLYVFYVLLRLAKLITIYIARSFRFEDDIKI